MDDACQTQWDTDSCEDEYLNHKDLYDFGESLQDPDDYMNKTLSHVCQPAKLNTTLYEACVKEIDYNKFDDSLRATYGAYQYKQQIPIGNYSD